ncbi:hypothetical protein SDC9_175219 [bioreactor metagenome]|uniref:Uncharacterized protein n=2 Tax=root TaxID=1 RepID=A0A0J7J142_9FLAO|nr:hypothetical protein [Chryseobacterium koreense]KMQ71786.1 hypothetical protein ACM44_06135 [Chryseobacterium koreense CCUG 49689]MBB5334273.1 DNA-binding transcriptional MerR regulator [Chryseobacterium koreense]
MTTITINNPNNFSLATLKKLLQSLDIEVVKIESEEEEIPAEHLPSIQKGLEELKQGLGKDSTEIRNKAREICSR